MKNTFEQDWKEAFDSFRTLSDGMRLMLRRGAADKMVEEGCEEVGSSDVNHKLFSEWKINSRNWELVLEYFYPVDIQKELETQAYLTSQGMSSIE